MHRHSAYQAAVDRVLTQAPGPLSAFEVHEMLSNTGIGLATVYRLLKRGVEDGRLAAVRMPQGPARYEPSDLPQHHHFECVACDRVFDVHGCPDGIDRLVPQGFEMDRHEVILSGRCSDCVASEGKAD